MVAVVSIFATLSEIAFKQLGVALASAVFVDATVVRSRPRPIGHEDLGLAELVLPRAAQGPCQLASRHLSSGRLVEAKKADPLGQRNRPPPELTIKAHNRVNPSEVTGPC